MSYLPDYERFAELAATAEFVPVYRQLVSDTLTPVQAFQRLDTSTAACLFESVIGGEKVGRYSFLTSDPFLWIKANGNEVTVALLDRSGSGNKTEPAERRSASRITLCNSRTFPGQR